MSGARKLLLGSVACVACAVALTASASTALAADLLPTKKGPPPAPVAAPYSWTGFNVGVQGGYGWGDENDNLSAYRVPADHFSANGAIGGAHVGYDQQFGSLVLGVRGEIDASGLSGSATAFIPNSPSVCFEGCSVSFRNTWQAFLLGRAGVAFDRLLVYAVGGLAVGDDRESVTTNIFEGTPGTASQTKTLYGGAIGLGAEYAFDEHWRLGAEWRYASFGKGDYSAALYEAVHAVPYKAGFSENLALVDLSYRF